MYSLWVVILAVLNGSPHFDRYGLSRWQIIAAYTAAGTARSLIVGLLRPWATQPFACALIGALCGPFGYGAVGVAMEGATIETARTALLLGVPVGLVCGVIMWKLQR